MMFFGFIFIVFIDFDLEIKLVMLCKKLPALNTRVNQLFEVINKKK